ncbi:MAG: heavy metal translocating P-type ATPase [Verrucomicrobiota bacterium]
MSSTAGNSTTLRVGGMDCSSCAHRVTQALTSVPGVASATVDLSAGSASIRWQPSAPVDPPALVAAVTAAGYSAQFAPKESGNTVRLRIGGMDCANCARKVTAALTGVAGVDSATVDLPTQRANVRWKPDQTGNSADLVAAVAAAGYTAELEAPGTDMAASVPPENPWKPALRLGIPVTALLLVGDWVLRLGMDRSFQWVAFLLATPVQFWVGGRFYRGAWRQARVGQSNMDTLVSLGSTAAFGFSVWGLFTGYHGHLYFMEAAAILTLISAGHWLEARMSTRAGTALKALLELAPATARRLEAGSGAEQDVPVASLNPGESIIIRPGDRIPVDATVLSGESAVDESMLTGEPVPVDKGTGSKLYTGTANTNGRLVARVEATGESTALAHIIAAVQRAQSSRAQVQRLADRVSSVFVPIVVLIAIATGAWWGFGYDSAAGVHGRLAAALWETHIPGSPAAAAFAMFAAVLIVACPCAMGLATPAALMAGVNAAARRGILIRDAVALEKSGRVTDIVFDKTGTLTVGHPTVVDSLDLRPDSNRRYSIGTLAAALARLSQHPLSQSLSQGFGNDGLPTISGWREIRGSGLESSIPEIGTGKLRLGSGAWLEGLGVPMSAAASFVSAQTSTGASVVFLASDSQLLGAIAVRDTLKPNARSVIERLQKSGLRVHLLTGDRKETAFVVAQELGLKPDAVAAGVRPEQKAEVLRRLQESGARIAFVGDGLNDGPALAQADLGIAVTQATDVAKEAADILLLKSDLGAIPRALDLAQTTLRVIRQNLFWAFFYNAAAIPLAITGLLSPVLCAAAMGFSDVIVIGNALRLNRR